MTFAKKYGLSFKKFEKDQFDDYKVIAELQSAKEELESFALQNEASVSTNATIKSMTALKKLRNKYLHISTNAYSSGMETNYEKGKVQRHVIKDNV